MYKRISCLFLVLLLGSVNVFAEGDPTFNAWLEALKEEARQNNISEETITQTFEQAEYKPRVIKLDRSQPEFISTFFSYIQKRVTSARIEAGREKLQEHEVLLDKIERHYDVPKRF